MACPPNYCGPPNACYPGQSCLPAPCYPSNPCYPSTQCYPSNYCNPCQPVCKQTTFTGSNTSLSVNNTNFSSSGTTLLEIPSKEQISYNVEIDGCGLSIVGTAAAPSGSLSVVQVAGCTTANTNCFTVTLKISEKASYEPSGSQTGDDSNLGGDVGVLYGTLKITCCGGNVSGCLINGLQGIGLWQSESSDPTPFSANAAAATASAQVCGTCCTTCGIRTITFTSININYTAVTAKSV